MTNTMIATAFQMPAEKLAFFAELWPWILVTQPLFLYLFGFYHRRPERPRLELARSVAFSVLAQTAALGAGLFFAKQAFPRSVLLLFATLDILLVSSWRSLLQRLERAPTRRVVVIGSGAGSVRIAAGHDTWETRACFARLTSLDPALLLPSRGEPVLADGASALRRALSTPSGAEP